MLSVSEIEGIVSGLDEAALVDKVYPNMVPGRVAHIDADFLAYMATFDPEAQLDDILHSIDVMVDDKRKECAAEFAVLHTTPSTSNKGGRFNVAIQREYQGQRDSKEKPQYLETARKYMGDMRGKFTGRAWEKSEADDGMSAASWEAHHNNESDLCVVASKDKDLRMVPGLHLNWDTGIIEGADDTFGYIDMLETVKVNSETGKTSIEKKAVGYGTKFFWLQMLMGDPADWIKGCPSIPAAVKNRFAATKQYLSADPDRQARMDRDPKRSNCGQVMAYSILKDAQDDRECLNRVMDCYRDLKVRHWETGDAVTWQEVLWSEAQMLWMQRTPGDIDDVKKWVKDEVLK